MKMILIFKSSNLKLLQWSLRMLFLELILKRTWICQSVQILSYNWKQLLAHSTLFDSNYQFENKYFDHNI